MNWIYLLGIYEIGLILIILWYTKSDYTSPAFITVGMFLLATLCTIFNINYWNVNFSSSAFLLIVSGLSVLTIVEILISSNISKGYAWIDFPVARYGNPIEVSRGTLFLISSTCFFMMGYYVAAVWRKGGGGLASISRLKYDTEISVNSLARLSNRVLRVVAYPCLYIFFNNVIWCKQKIRKNIKLLIPVSFSAVSILFSGTRGPYLYMIFTSIIYVAMFERYKNGWRKINLNRYLKPLIIFVVIFLVGFYSTSSITKGRSTSFTFIQYFTYYLGSPVHLLSKLMDNLSKGYPKQYSIPGVNVFTSLFEELYNWGIFKEEVHLGQTGFIYVGGSFDGGGNAFTMFGAIYNDYGFFGSLVFVGIFYGIIDLYYYKKIKYRRRLIPQGLSLLVYGYFSFLVFMNFFVCSVIYLKVQTIIEVLVMVTIYQILSHLRLCVGSYK